MTRINTNYLKLPKNYLFSEIGRKVKEYADANPDKSIICLGIGDVTQPLPGKVIEAMHKAVDEMAVKETFRGYAPDMGYDFLRQTVAKNDYKDRGINIAADEIFISDGAKCDSGNIQEIFGIDNVIAVCDPVYPVYVDSNVMAGRGGIFDAAGGNFSDIVYMPCIKENGFVPEIPREKVDIIYLCFPNNPTGAVISKEELQKWVDYANENESVIIYDAAYEAYITQPGIPHSVYECDGADRCAIELHSFSKNAGFTGVRLGYTVVPQKLLRDGESLNLLWKRRHSTKYNGAPYIIQRAGEAVYSDEGKAEVRALVDYYMNNASYILNNLKDAGYEVSGGVNAPYIWLATPNGMSGWEFFDLLLTRANVVGTPGSGFGPHGEGYLRLTAFGDHENTVEAIDRIKRI